MPSSQVIEAIAVTAELCGRVFSPAAAVVFASDLDGYPEKQVLAALARCRKEVKGLLTVAEVVSRIEDGRPGSDQAWAMLPHDEDMSAVWTAEMAQAWGIAKPLLGEGDKVGARFAFREAYNKLVADARDKKEPAKWSVTFGHEISGRVVALENAVRAKRLSLNHAVELLPHDAAQGLLRSLGVTQHPLLAPPDPVAQAKVRAMLADLRAKLTP